MQRYADGKGAQGSQLRLRGLRDGNPTSEDSATSVSKMTKPRRYDRSGRILQLPRQLPPRCRRRIQKTICAKNSDAVDEMLVIAEQTRPCLMLESGG